MKKNKHYRQGFYKLTNPDKYKGNKNQVTSLPAEPLYNIVTIGKGAEATGSNQIVLGNSVSTVYTQVGVQIVSDARDKADIKDSSLGLDFITRLRPVEYKSDSRSLYYDESTDPVTQTKRKQRIPKDGSKAGKRPRQGLVAQEVKQVMDELGVDFAGYQDHSINGGADQLSLSYEQFVGPLIKAVQELSQQNQELRARIEKLEK